MLVTILRLLMPGFLLAGGILIFIILLLLVIINQATDISLLGLWKDGYWRHIIWFTFFQASLSTLLSILLAIPCVYALSRRQFKGKDALLRCFSLTLVMPVLIGVVGLLVIYGNHGLINQWLSYCGLKGFSFYGAKGIVLAHIFFNLPLAIRFMLPVIELIPSQQHQLAGHLGITGWYKFRWIVWPTLRQQIPHVAGLIFMLCFSSFAIVMTLGGGPASTTMEVALYQAIRYEFDFSKGAQLALWQVLICSVLVIITHCNINKSHIEINPVQSCVNFFSSKKALYWDSLWIVLSACIVLLPLIAVVIAGLNNQFFVVLSDVLFWQAAAWSLFIALMSSGCAFCLTIIFLCTSRYLRLLQHHFLAVSIEAVGMVILVMPGVVLSTGMFLLLHSIQPSQITIALVIVLINTLMALPFMLKILSQPMWQMAKQYHILCASLGMTGLSRLKMIEWPLLKQPLIQAIAMGFVLSLGDLTAIAVFGESTFQTLPLYLFDLLSRYQIDATFVVTLLLLILSLFVFALVGGENQLTYSEGKQHAKIK